MDAVQHEGPTKADSHVNDKILSEGQVEELEYTPREHSQVTLKTWMVVSVSNPLIQPTQCDVAESARICATGYLLFQPSKTQLMFTTGALITFGATC